MIPFSRKTRYCVCASVVLIMVAGLVYWRPVFSPESTPAKIASLAEPANEISSTLPVVQKEATSLPADHVSSADRPLPASTLISPSQYDTEIDGRLQEDKNGNLIVDIGFRDLFDYFFSALGEKTPEQIAANMAQYIDSTLSPKAAEQARALLKSFMAYNRDLAEYGAMDNTDVYDLHGRALVDHLQAYHTYLAAARERHFGPEYSEVFFQNEEKYQAYNIARLELSLADLPKEEKQRRIGDLRSRLPERQQEIIRDHERVNEFMSKEKAWQEEGVSRDELYDRRLADYGYDAAERMAALDERNRVWESRLHDFFEEVDQIHATDWPEADKKELVEEIKASSFSERERLRVAVIERYRQKNNNNRN